MANDEKQKPTFQTFTAEQLLSAVIEAPEFIVKDLLPCGFVLLPAPPKTGKSWLSLSLADAVANGRAFWGRTTNQGDVLYLALEDNAFRLQSRLNILGIMPSTALQFVTRGVLTLRTGLLDQIENWAYSVLRPRLIVVDTLARVRDMNNGKADMYTADSNLYSPIQQLAMKLKICVLAVTHYNKTSKYSSDDPYERIQGSTGLFGVADAVWAITGKRGEGEKTLSIVGRDVLAQEYKIRLNDDCRWDMLGTSEELEQQRRMDQYLSSPLRKTVIALINPSGKWTGTATELAEQIKKNSKKYQDNVNTLGRYITASKQFFSEIDGISCTQADGGAHGRAYTFQK